eukprot:scaffold27387_cov63-Phaeocystis_antarctica.AAC.4
MSVHPSLSRAGVAQGSALGLGATAPSALGWYRLVLKFQRLWTVNLAVYLFNYFQSSSVIAHAHSTSPHIDVLPVLVSTYEPLVGLSRRSSCRG